MNDLSTTLSALAVLIWLAWLRAFWIDRWPRRAARLLPAEGPGKPVTAMPILGSDPGLDAVRLRHDDATDDPKVPGRFHVLAEAVDIGVLVLTPDGELEYANERARSLFGCADRAEIEQRIRELKSGLLPVLEHRPTASTPHSVQLAVAVDGQPRALRIERWTNSDAGSDVIIALVRDGAVHHDAETQLRLATYLRGLSRVHAATLHELRGPLNAISLHLALLREVLGEDVEAGVREKHLRYVGVVEQESRRLHHTIEEAFGHLRATDTTAVRFDLRDVIVELQALLAPHCRKRRTHLRVRMPEVAVSIDGSREVLKQAVFGVLLTALDALPQEGRLDVVLAPGAGFLTLHVSAGDEATTTIETSELRMTHPTDAPAALLVARSAVGTLGGRIRVSSTFAQDVRCEIELPLPTQQS